MPVLDFVEAPAEVKPGDQVVSSGEGGLYPADIVIGRVVVGPDGRQRVRLAADTRRLDFVRVVRGLPSAPVEGPGGLIGPVAAPPDVRRRRGGAMNAPRALPAVAETGGAARARGGRRCWR